MNAKDSIISTLSPTKKRTFAIIAITCSVLLSVWAANKTLRFLEKFRAARHLDYDAACREGGLGPGGYLKEKFEAQVSDGYGGSVRWKNNTQGFRSDRDFSQTPPLGVMRILSLGDSFTAGYRVDQADTFSKLLEDWSTENLSPTEVLVSQITEPHFGLTYMQKYGHAWSPHVVLLGITLGNDIAQTYVARHPTSIGFRHGLEEFDLPDQCFKQRSWIVEAVIKKAYYLSRSRLSMAIFHPSEEINNSYGRKVKTKLFDAQNGLGMYIKNPPKEIEEAYQRLFEILSDFKFFCARHNMNFAVLVFPQRFQVQPGDWCATVTAYNLNPKSFDLMGPNKRIQEFCARESIPCIDPTDAMKEFHLESGQNLYLPQGDMHWNREGHRAWFEGAQSALKSVLQTASRHHAIIIDPNAK